MWDIEDVVRFTIGKLIVEPNAPSVVPSKVVFSIDLRVIRKPLDDINVRKALAHAIDYDYHLNVALAGYGKRAKGH